MLERERAVAWYRRNRERSRALFDLVREEAYYTRPITLRHPIVFYEGHLPAFSFNTLVKRALGGASIDEPLEALFARGIDPDESAGADSSKSQNPNPKSQSPSPKTQTWPSRDEVRAFADEADARVLDVLQHADLDRPGHPLLDRAEAAFTILEHEAMHHETLLYMWHRLPIEQKHRPHAYQPHVNGAAPTSEWVEIPRGQATLGVDRAAIPFGWDNEFGAARVDVPGFAIERHNVTNRRFVDFVDAGGYQNPRWWMKEDWEWLQREQVAHPLFWERRGDEWYWRGMFDVIPLPPSWPVYVSHAEASAFARWSGARLPTEAEYQRAAFGSPDGERGHPWGDDDPSARRGVFDFSSWDPEPAGSHPAGASAWGVEDLVGNGWEWTSTTFAPFAEFRPMASYPEYSSDFFDGQHMVIKGGSSATARELLRPTFRNWFRSRYPYVYATFRLVADHAHVVR